MAARTPLRAQPATTWRGQQKANRREQLLHAAARLLAERGYHRVRLEDLGLAVGISGPAIYRHFASKEALLIELLTDISQRLLAGGAQIAASITDPHQALERLIDFHLDFTINEPDLIRVQDRDLSNLPTPALRRVRRIQRQYVETWVHVLRHINVEFSEADMRVTAHAVFGLLNSTPHSTNPSSPAQTRAILRGMAIRAIAPKQSDPE